MRQRALSILVRWDYRGIRAGMWTEDQIAEWLGKGRWKRKDGQTKPPIRPHSEWREERLAEDATSSGEEGEIPF